MVTDATYRLRLIQIMKTTSASAAITVAIPKLSIRINFSEKSRIGPGKIALLEELEKNGSISGVGRALKMNRRKAGELIDEMNRSLGLVVVETAAGGAKLTDAGREIVSQYRELEDEVAKAAHPHFARLLEVCKLT
jgi:molybdate transport system regulatory protein